ncbi:MAG TPA: dihydrofolate reductase family protein [Candidatus Dormibacteraeota bacterium]|nr:dihydrofolate reductase family protein [Candidatus Dormibacteraeota bacterium]
MPENWLPAAESLDPLELLFQGEGQPEYALPTELAALYGGPFGLPPSLFYSNFVTSLDGVAVVGPSSGSILSGHSQADRFVMGLLRACADSILIGSGTLSGSPGHVWTAEHVYPPAAAAYRQLRQHLGLPERPTLVIVSGSGSVDLDHPGLAVPALLLTSEEGRSRLARATRHQVVAIGPGPELDPAQMVEAVRRAGHRVILTEGGPRLLGQLLRAGQLDQLFLTVSPLLAGRPAGERRAGFVEGVDLLGAGEAAWLNLLSARREGSHLFLRYLVAGADRRVESDHSTGPE